VLLVLVFKNLAMEKEKANIGDTIKTISGDEFIVMSEDTDDRGTQWVYRVSDEEADKRGDDMIFAWDSYGVPDTNFIIIKRASENF
jgi:hypothetical protein